ncbi:MAG: hypothetical protein ACYSUI_12830 [Planctomycetota bacterium]
MNGSKRSLLATSAAVLFCSGCGHQGITETGEVTLQITDSATGEPVPGAHFTAAVVATGESWLVEHYSYAEILDRYEEDSGVTDENGKAVIHVEEDVGCLPGGCPNKIANVPLLLRIESEIGVDFLRFESTPGESTSGELFTATVLSVDRTR